MSSDERIAVRCVGCGQVYHVPPPEQDQHAKCRGCGREFVISAARGERRATPRRTKDQAASEYHFSQAIAAKLGEAGRNRASRLRGVSRPLVALLAALGVAGGLVYTSMPRASESLRLREDLQRGRVAKLAAPRGAYGFPAIADLVEAVEPSIVQVETERGIGSGFVLTPEGLIVTCHHCVKWADEARVLFADRREADVVGVRALRPGSDLVILQVNLPEPLTALPLTATPPRKGEPLVAFGSPAGLSFTVSEGAVSAQRSVGEISQIAGRLRGGGSLSLAPRCELLQFTATAMPGHSGGPVVDFRGNVLGITSFGLPYEGRSFEFAISATEIRELASELDPTATPLDEVWEEELARLRSLLEAELEIGPDLDSIFDLSD